MCKRYFSIVAFGNLFLVQISYVCAEVVTPFFFPSDGKNTDLKSERPRCVLHLCPVGELFALEQITASLSLTQLPRLWGHPNESTQKELKIGLSKLCHLVSDTTMFP